jgi:long-chain acyl-CoA synthetase
MISDWAGEQPNRVAIMSDLGNRTFGELDARANQLVRALRRRGVEPGAAVTLMCRNRPEFAEVWAASLRGGYRLTPINWHLTGDSRAVWESC